MRPKTLDDDQLSAIRRLRLQLNRRVDSIFVGAYKSAFRGSGLEFEDVRPYSPGDDVRQRSVLVQLASFRAFNTTYINS